MATDPALPRKRLKVGISACFFHADDSRPIFAGKTLQYLEQSAAHWVMSTGALAVMIPNPEGDTGQGDATVADYAGWLDALVLEGGSDVWPGSYGEQPLDPAGRATASATPTKRRSSRRSRRVASRCSASAAACSS